MSSLVDDVRRQADQLVPPSTAPDPLQRLTDPDPIRRLQAQADHVLFLLADLKPAAASRLREISLAFSYYQVEEFEKLQRLSKRLEIEHMPLQEQAQTIVNLWADANEDALEITRLRTKINALAPGSRLASEVWRLDLYAKGMIAIHSHALEQYNKALNSRGATTP